MIKLKNFITTHFNLFVFLIITITIFSLYGKSLFFNYVYFDDDILILNRHEYLSFSNIKNIFTDSVFGTATDTFIRPLLNISFLIDKYLYELNPQGYHFTNLLIHILSVFFIFLLLTLRYEKIKTFFICLLFAVHPAIVQAVAWIPGRNDSLLALFVVLSFYFFVRYLNENKKIFFSLYLIFFIVSLLIKETAIIIPALCFMLLIYKRNINKIFIFIVSCISIIILYLSYRNFILGTQIFSGNFKELIINFLISFPAITKYIANIFFPLKLSIFPMMIEINYLLCLATILTFILFFIKFKNYNIKIILFGFIWFFFFLFPTFLVSNNQFYDHRIYLPLIGILIVILEITNSHIKKSITTIILLFSLIFIYFSSITFYYEGFFKDKETFWFTAYTDSLNPAEARNYKISNMVKKLGSYDEETKLYLKKIELKNEERYYDNLAISYIIMGNMDNAEKYLLKALSLRQDNPVIYYNLASIYKYTNKIENAKKMKELYIKVFNETNPNKKPLELEL